uniref:Ig-like domain-containing protein n=1 Tax=Pelusios castaneus TaxID=367368 RepID=A0A8C8RQW7_9SAUR
LSQVQLVEFGRAVVKPRDTLTLTCAVSGLSITDFRYSWDWICKPSTKGLEWIARIHPADGDNQITITTDLSKNQVFLKLCSLTAADTATYYCTRATTVTWSEAGIGSKGGRSGKCTFPFQLGLFASFPAIVSFPLPFPIFACLHPTQHTIRTPSNL